MSFSKTDKTPLERWPAASRTDHEQTNLKRQIDATDRRIDHLVYYLYNLTDEEIRIAEEDKNLNNYKC